MSDYKTTCEFGPFGDCQTIVYYEYTPCPSGDAGKVEVTGGKFYDLDEKWIEFGAETAMNLREPAQKVWIEEEIREWHEEQGL